MVYEYFTAILIQLLEVECEYINHIFKANTGNVYIIILHAYIYQHPYQVLKELFIRIVHMLQVHIVNNEPHCTLIMFSAKLTSKLMVQRSNILGKNNFWEFLLSTSTGRLKTPTLFLHDLEPKVMNRGYQNYTRVLPQCCATYYVPHVKYSYPLLTMSYLAPVYLIHIF